MALPGADEAAPAASESGAVFPPAGAVVIVFDVVGTLIEPSPSVAVAYHRAAIRHGVELDPAEIKRRFRAAWRRQDAIDAAAAPAFATDQRREAGRWRQIVRDVFGDAVTSAAIFADLWDHFGRIDAWRPVPRGDALLRAALDAGATVALASNFDERLVPLAAGMESLARVRHVFPSSEIGWRKPSAQFFRWIERKLECLPHEAVLVGDDPWLDHDAARRAGWRAVDVGNA